MHISGTDLSEAVVLYLRFDDAPMPRHDHERLLAQFGPDKGQEIGQRVETLMDELGRVKIDWSAHSLDSGTDAARAEMKAKHPELSERALDALAWKFSYDWK